MKILERNKILGWVVGILVAVSVFGYFGDYSDILTLDWRISIMQLFFVVLLAGSVASLVEAIGVLVYLRSLKHDANKKG
jgi:hypothetical protein